MPASIEHQERMLAHLEKQERAMKKPKKINCKWCGMGHAPRDDGNHWIVKSIIPAKIDIKECAYHKAGAVSPIAQEKP